MVHAENINIINRIRPVIEASGRQDLAAWTDSRPTCSEVLAIEKAIHIAKVTETPLYITHISTADSVDVIARAKAEGVDVIAETCPQYLILTKYSNLGPLGKTNPPLRDKESNERLWRGINDNTVECMGTDHSTHKRKAKQDIWTALPGISGMEYFLSLMLSEGVNKGRLTLEKLVEMCCYNNARIFGIYPRKGTISVGSDADLVIIDLNKSGTLSVNTSHQLSDFCAYEGWKVKGLPLLTMIRGNVVAENGKLIAGSGIGRYIPRPMH
jgi:dihydropyrimidinase/dihydroorotase